MCYRNRPFIISILLNSKKGVKYYTIGQFSPFFAVPIQMLIMTTKWRTVQDPYHVTIWENLCTMSTGIDDAGSGESSPALRS